MLGSLPLGDGFWLVPLIVLAVGTALIVGLAAIAARWVRSAAWHRTIWQATTVGLLALLVCELTGSGSAFVQLLRAGPKPTDADTRPAPGELGGTGVSPVGARKHGQDARATRKTAVDTPLARSGGQVAEGLLFQRAAGVPLNPPPLSVSVPWARAPVAEPEGEVGESAPSQSSSDGLAVTAFVRSEFLPDVPPSGPPSAPMNRVTTSHSVGRSELTTAAGAWPAVIWAIGAVAIAGRFVWARLLLVVFRRRHAVVRDEALCRHIAALARRQGLRRPVTVLEAAGLTAPVAFGIFRPTLALPTTFSGEFDPPQQEAMIVHELAHLAGRDPGWQLAADLVCAALWWHPLCWWSRRRLREAGEAAADEASLLVPDGPDLLASSLLVLGQRLVGVRPRLGWLSAGGPDFRSGLGRRVERLLELSDRSWQAPRRAPLALAKTALPVALVIVALLSTAWARPQAALREGGTTMSVLKTSWRRSLAAAAVAAILIPISGDVMSQEEGDRPAAERREREGRERGEHPRGEREHLMHQVEVLRLAMHALREAERGDAVELVERAIRAAEVTLEGRRDDEAHQIRQQAPPPPELAEILGMAADLWREFDKPDKAEEVARLAAALRAPRDPERGRERERDAERSERRPDQGQQLDGLFGYVRQQLEMLETALPALRGAERGDAVELAERAIRARHIWLERRHDEEAREIAERNPHPAQVAEVLAMAAELFRESGNGEKAEAAAKLARRLAGEAGQGQREERPAADRERAEREERRRELLPPLKREFDELAEKAQRIERELGELPDDQVEEAQELRGALAETRQRMEQVKRRMTEVLRVRASHDAAEREREMAERRRHQEGRPERPEGPPPEEREEMERRANHVRVAVENLHAAGLHEQAEQLAGQMERLLRGRPEPPRHHPREVDGPPRREGPPHAEQLEGVLRELHGTIGQLNERMEGLAHKVENEIQEVRHGVEVMGREIEERTNHFNQRGENLEREIRELEARLAKLKDLDDEDDDDKDDDDDDDDDDDEEEEDDDG